MKPPIVVLLVCLFACERVSPKQKEAIDASVQDTLKDLRYDSIVSFEDHRSQDIKEAEKSHLHKDSLKGEFFEVLTNAKRRKQLKDNQILLLTKESAPYEQSSGDFYRVNAGSWWELTQGEKYLMMGYYGDDAIKRGFINGVYDWSSVQ